MNTLWRWLVYGVPGATLYAVLKKSAGISRWTTSRVKWWRNHWAMATVGYLTTLVLLQFVVSRKHPGAPSFVILILCVATMTATMGRAALGRFVARTWDAFVGP